MQNKRIVEWMDKRKPASHAYTAQIRSATTTTSGSSLQHVCLGMCTVHTRCAEHIKRIRFDVNAINQRGQRHARFARDIN